ncbi:PD40 domain-containing protein [candidate division WOR-3 bacterium]|nr:PD40 domain-containing protein [candidate division WOR-3 bacterium]
MTLLNYSCDSIFIDDDHAEPDTLPRFTRHCWGPTWNPDGQTIAFGYVPWIRIGKDSLVEKWDSSGIFLIDANGSNKRPLFLAGIAPFFCNPDYSPDGLWLVFVSGPVGEVNDIHKAKIKGDSITQLTFSYWNRHPKWSPDGKKILFGRYQAPRDSTGLCLMSADGSNNKVIICENSMGTGDFLPDYRIVFEGWVEGIHGIWLTDTSGSYKHQIFNKGYGHVSCSPDGSEVLFSLYNEGKLRYEIWVMNIDGTNARSLCIDAVDPCWNPDGSKIIYIKFNYYKSATTHPGYGELWIMDADGSNPRQLTFIDYKKGDL